MNQATPVGKKPVYYCTPLYLCTSDPTPKPRYIPKPPKQQQRPYKTGQIVRTRHHIGQPVQSENTRPLTPPLNYRPRAANKVHTPRDLEAEAERRFQALHPKYHENNLLEQQAELQRYQPLNKLQTIRDRILALY